MRKKNRLIKLRKDFLYRYNDKVRCVESVILIIDVEGKGVFKVRSKELFPERGREDIWESNIYTSPEFMEVIGHKNDYPEYMI